MKRALVTFLVLMTLLGLGTIVLVERFSGEQILPRRVTEVSLNELQSRYRRFSYQVKRWWHRAERKAQNLGIKSETSTDQKIIKWQDRNGVWHFEQQGVAPMPNSDRPVTTQDVEASPEDNPAAVP